MGTHRGTWLATVIGLIGIAFFGRLSEILVMFVLKPDRDGFGEAWYLDLLLHAMTISAFLSIGAMIIAPLVLSFKLVLRPTHSSVKWGTGISLFGLLLLFVNQLELWFDSVFATDKWSSADVDAFGSLMSSVPIVIAGPFALIGVSLLTRTMGYPDGTIRSPQMVRNCFLWVGWTSFIFLQGPFLEAGLTLADGNETGPRAEPLLLSGFALFLLLFTRIGWRLTLRLLHIPRPAGFPPKRSRRFLSLG